MEYLSTNWVVFQGFLLVVIIIFLLLLRPRGGNQQGGNQQQQQNPPPPARPAHHAPRYGGWWGWLMVRFIQMCVLALLLMAVSWAYGLWNDGIIRGTNANGSTYALIPTETNGVRAATVVAAGPGEEMPEVDIKMNRGGGSTKPNLGVSGKNKYPHVDGPKIVVPYGQWSEPICTSHPTDLTLNPYYIFNRQRQNVELDWEVYEDYECTQLNDRVIVKQGVSFETKGGKFVRVRSRKPGIAAEVTFGWDPDPRGSHPVG